MNKIYLVFILIFHVLICLSSNCENGQVQQVYRETITRVVNGTSENDTTIFECPNSDKIISATSAYIAANINSRVFGLPIFSEQCYISINNTAICINLSNIGSILLLNEIYLICLPENKICVSCDENKTERFYTLNKITTSGTKLKFGIESNMTCQNNDTILSFGCILQDKISGDIVTFISTTSIITHVDDNIGYCENRNLAEYNILTSVTCMTFDKYKFCNDSNCKTTQLENFNLNFLVSRNDDNVFNVSCDEENDILISYILNSNFLRFNCKYIEQNKIECLFSDIFLPTKFKLSLNYTCMSNNGLYKICDDSDLGCVHSQGFWKNHLELWPIDPNTEFCGFSFSEGIKIMPKGNKFIITSIQYIAAKLNILNGADSTNVQDHILEFEEIYLPICEDLIHNFDIKNETLKDDLLFLKDKFEDFNLGETDVPQCDEIENSKTKHKNISENIIFSIMFILILFLIF